MKTKLLKILGIGLVGIGVASVCSASVPEIDPASGVNALAVLGGALLILRSRRR